MTAALENAVSQLSKLTEEEQDRLAELLLQELAWIVAFIRSQNQLAWLADEALNEWKQGRTKPMNEWL